MSRLERWSRKKRGIEHESDDRPPAEPVEPQLEVETHAPESDGIDASSPAVDEQEAAAPPLPGSLDHTLPDPDTLPAGSDFSAFMVPGVSAALRRRALRRLWATGNYNVRDGLDDYDADYTQQLKPMASELAGKLRRWANKAEETLEKLEDAGQKEKAQEETSPAPASDQTSACTSDDSFVQSASLNDQSDYSDHALGERKKDG
ncbi:DUF3306 domain-containing protein [Halomonas sp. Cn5-12]|uniref:DUF3306 domain-containing protein n=1 Tax=Halomonas sp. Cn5-12 TaxID=2908885 RepID=UPI001F363210|nr:DUF3306 domain-containing protein [Halomonas sp. Cn5-12]MCF2912757.1 DUF3306 domain-containing protein [Halomonas sp. Cn5-12]